MFIGVVDEALEQLLRDRLPFPAQAGDISLEIPSRAWVEGLTRDTINLFLFDLTRSATPNRAPTRRVDENGRHERRRPQPMVEMNYLVSVFAGGVRAEHELLGRIVSVLAALDVLPEEYLPRPLSSSVNLAFVDDDNMRARDIWNGAGGTLKAAFSLQVTVAADSFDWTVEPTAVSAIQGSAGPVTDPAGTAAATS